MVAAIRSPRSNVSFRLPSLQQTAVSTLAAFALLVTATTATAADTTPPVTGDDVPATYRTSAVAVTLQATDGPGGSGVATTVFTTGILPTQPTALSPVYDPADKPVLVNGERISYFSTDLAGNAEAVKTSRPAIVAPESNHFGATALPLSGSGFAGLAVADVTGDGQLDIISAANGSNIVTVTARNASGTGWDEPAVAGSTGTQPWVVAVGDVTGDGRPDLVTANAVSADLTVIARNASGTDWEAPTTAGSTGQSPHSLVVADVTGDGRADLVTGHYSQSGITVVARNDDGTGWLPTENVSSGGSVPMGVAVEDVTGDGQPDLVAANLGSDTVSVVARNADGTGWDAPVTAGTTDPRPYSLTVADVNGDGLPDLVTPNVYSNTVTVIARRSDDSGWEPSVTAGATGDWPSSVAVGDLTGDGLADIAVADSSSARLSLLVRNDSNDGWEGRRTIGGTVDGARTAAIADVTGDGRADVIVSNYGPQKVTLLTAFYDVAAPVTTDDVPADHRSSPVQVTLDASDGAGGSGVADTYYTTGTSPDDPTTASATYDPADKPTLSHGERVKYFSVDDAGNTEAVKTSAAAQVDETAPTTTDNVDADWHDAPVAVTLTATDDGSGVTDTYYTVGTTPETPTTSSPTYDPADKPTLNDGEKISYFSVDEVGNAESVKTSSAAKVDETAPTTTDNVDADWHDAPVAVTLTATDDGSGVTDTYYTVGITPETPTAASATYDPADKPTLNDGEKIAYFSVDNAGNTETVKTSAAAKVDPSVPDTVITTGPADVGSDARPSIAFSSPTPEVGFECALDDGAFAACVSPFQPTSALDDGRHVFRVRAVTRAGLFDPSPAELAFVVDTAVPQVPDLLGGPPAVSSETTVSIGFAIEPDATATCSVDGGTFVPCTSPLTLTDLTVGEHELRIVQTDRAGNAGPPLRIPFTVTAKPIAKTDPPVGPVRLSLDTGLSLDTAGRVPTVFRGGSATIGCRADRGQLQRCTAVARSTRALKTRAGKRLPKGTVLARASSTSGIAAASALATELRLTAAARSALTSRPLGLTARLTTTVTTPTGQTITSSTLLRLMRSDRLVLPVAAGANGSLSAANKKMLARLVRTVGNAKAVRCGAYTDNTRPASVGQKMTVRQAQTACRYLQQRGLRAKQTVQGHGSTRPRSSNRTAKGRAMNRRLEITMTV